MTLQTRWPQGVAPEAVDTHALVRGFAGCDFEYEVLVANAWTPHLVVAESYRTDRVLLAGDAAHQYIPTGGYGMNTGIGDACDLGWKLAAVLHGFGGPGLLASYSAERRPICVTARLPERHASQPEILKKDVQHVLDRFARVIQKPRPPHGWGNPEYCMNRARMAR